MDATAATVATKARRVLRSSVVTWVLRALAIFLVCVLADTILRMNQKPTLVDMLAWARATVVWATYRTIYWFTGVWDLVNFVREWLEWLGQMLYKITGVREFIDSTKQLTAEIIGWLWLPKDIISNAFNAYWQRLRELDLWYAYLGTFLVTACSVLFFTARLAPPAPPPIVADNNKSSAAGDGDDEDKPHGQNGAAAKPRRSPTSRARRDELQE